MLPLVKNGKIEVTIKLPDAARATITPEEGGTVEVTAQTTTIVEFPPNAVGAEVTATLRTTRNDPVNAGPVAFLGDPVEIALGDAAGVSRSALPQPFTITIAYKDSDIPKGVPEEALAVYWLNPDANLWAPRRDNDRCSRK